MTAKYKAIELVDKFSKDFQYVFSDIISKKHALIAVNEIINSNPHSNPFNTELHSTMDYWIEVKNEINKL